VSKDENVGFFILWTERTGSQPRRDWVEVIWRRLCSRDTFTCVAPWDKTHLYDR